MYAKNLEEFDEKWNKFKQYHLVEDISFFYIASVPWIRRRQFDKRRKKRRKTAYRLGDNVATQNILFVDAHNSTIFCSIMLVPLVQDSLLDLLMKKFVYNSSEIILYQNNVASRNVKSYFIE
ncbi:hypothetical protein BDC45DRAFT_538554 [Circinella umbellata]|nr:hypothetical protein BDC45DRAFT_538554 [Circinella umbellata]